MSELAISSQNSNSIRERLSEGHEKKNWVQLPRKGFGDTTVGFVTEKWDNFFNLLVKVTDWSNYFEIVPKEHHTSFNNFRWTSNIAKLSHGPVELVSTFHKFCGSLKETVKDPSAKRFYNLFFDANANVNPIWDSVDLASKTFLTIPTEVLRPLEGINGGALILSMSKLSYESLDTIANSNMADAKTEKAKNKEATIISQAIIDLGKGVFYVALGVCIVASIFFSMVAPPIVFLSLSTAALTCSIFSYYHKNLGMPIEAKKPDFYWMGV